MVSGPRRGGRLAWWFTRLAVYRAGGKAVRVTTGSRRIPADFDALIIGGGADVHPDLYGQSLQLPHPERQRSLWRWLLALVMYPLLFMARWLFSLKRYTGPDRDRDGLEYRLLAEALRHDRPVLGICRGAQLLNVYLNGTLHQDISGFYTESAPAWSLLPCKTIDIISGSQLQRIMQTTRCQVNALHNQSINELGNQVRMSAHETNGIVQAIEAEQHHYMIGVQWHPEYLPHHARQQRLFRGLISAAMQNRGEPSSELAGKAGEAS